MNIKQLLEAAKKTPPSEEQIKNLRKRLEAEKPPKITKEFLERYYSL